MEKIDQWQEDIRGLIDCYDTLESFQEVTAWIQKAQKALEDADEIHVKMSEGAMIVKVKLSAAVEERKQKSFLKRTFGSRKEEEEFEKQYNGYTSKMKAVGDVKGSILEKIKRLPNNKAVQKEWLKNLSLQKKDLNIQKREVNEKMRQVNAAARKARASARSLTSDDRVYINRQKEDYLTPLEAKRTEIETKLAYVDKEILRLNRLKFNEEILVNVTKCKYCGREYNQEPVCPACGAPK